MRREDFVLQDLRHLFARNWYEWNSPIKDGSSNKGGKVCGAAIHNSVIPPATSHQNTTPVLHIT